MKTLSKEELDRFLSEQPEWRLEDGTLVRNWEFPDFAGSMVFVNGVATLAEEANHHPDIDIRYNKVRLSLVSHDAGGLTKRDAGLAKSITALFPTPARRGPGYE